MAVARDAPRAGAKPVRRGPAPSFTRAQVAEAAIRIADEQGMDAVSMRKVAGVLGTGAMSLYRYVDNKDSLCMLMLDHLYGEVVLRDRSGDWRKDLHTVADHLRDTQRKHPWLARIAAGRPAMGPNMLQIFEYAMASLDGLGLSIEDMLGNFSLIASWVTGFVQEELAEAEARRNLGLDKAAWDERMAASLQSLLGSGDYPYFARVVQEGADHDFDTRFDRGIDRIIKGIEASLPQPS